MRSRLLGCALAIAAMSAVAAHAQTEVKRTTKVEVKGGKDITTTGCVERMGDGRYSLTGVGGEVQYNIRSTRPRLSTRATSQASDI